ncbi:MAG: alpha/beta hydrolase-fold protein, partial [Nonlabens sp.]|nr:alpha/beta hydrolase-fold protein [Nonlabens sp.]
MIRILILLTTCMFSCAMLSQNVVIDSVKYNDSYRTVRLLLPENYKLSANHKVLVMLDAQNLFDEKTSYAGEWQVDEYVKSLPLEQQAIVIGVDHGNALRMNELTPYKNEKYGGGDAAHFMEWLVQEALPQISKKYGINMVSGQTAIAGSSLGGLFAHYAALSHPELFRAAGVFSPSYWFSEEFYGFVQNQPIAANQLFYLSAGTAESKDMIPDMQRMYELMRNKTKNYVLYKKEIKDAQHNEAQWR